MQFRHGCAVICLALLPGCASMGWSTHPTASIEDRDVMRETILEHIPPGTTLEDAQEFMEDGGFECRLLEDDGTRAEPEDQDYHLYCDRHDSVRWPVSRRWQVSIGLEDDRVTDVSASEGYVGP